MLKNSIKNLYKILSFPLESEQNHAFSMEIDPNISNWILEFLLRQPLLDDTTLNSLLRCLPLPTNSTPTLQKLILLRTLHSQLSKNALSERTLDLFEHLEEIQYRQGAETASDAMKRAYCAAAVACTVGIGGGGDVSFRFFEGVRRVWKGRIGRMGKKKKGLLCSDELWGWKEGFEAAVWEDGGWERVVKKCEGVDAVRAVGEYLRDERERMGPSFLELAAERVREDGVMRGVLGVGSGVGRVDGEEGFLCGVDGVMNVGNVGDEMPKKKFQLSKQRVSLTSARELPSRSPKRAKLVDTDEMTLGSPSHCDLPCSAEVNKVREALGSSLMELQAVVNDPLPDALRIAEAISGVAKENEDHDPVEENHVEHSPNVSNVHRPSLMQRNSSAHSYEWDGSQDPGCRGRLQLPSPRVLNISPLKRYETKNLKVRRKRMKWSLLEEDTLRTGVQKYGKGNWKVILTAYRDIFNGRTDGDLKDKWRNMT